MTDEIKEIESLFYELGYPKDAPVTLKVRHLIAMAKSLKEENSWIPVNECLPKECDSKHESIFVDEQWIDPDIGGPITINVTHWKKNHIASGANLMMQLQVGKTYQSHRPAETMDLDGEIINFQSEIFTFTVLPKPDEVTAVTVDIHGEEREIIKLPRHLQKPEWHWIRKENGTACWFNQNHRQITEI